MTDRRARIRKKTEVIWESAKYASVGLEFGVSITLCYFAGRWLQNQYDFAPWGVLGGIILGFTAGLRRLIIIAQIESKSSSSATTKDEEEDPCQKR